MPYFLFTLLGFVLGSTLFAYWIPKLLKNIDKLTSVCTCFSCTCLWTCISFFTKTKRRQSYYRLLRSPFGPVSGIASGCLSSIFLYILFSCGNNKSTFAQIYSDIWFFCIQCPFDYKNSLNPDWLLHNRSDCDIRTPDKAQ